MKTYDLETNWETLHLVGIIDAIDLFLDQPTTLCQLAILRPLVPDMALLFKTFRCSRSAKVGVFGRVDTRDGETGDRVIEDVVHCCRNGHEGELLCATVWKCWHCLHGSIR